jgi:uncharacterized protein YgiM (DUF1202 family)
MKRSSRRVLIAALAAMLPAAAFAQETPTEQPAAETVKFVGEIVGNDVYVRSGPDQNYYPVTQLDAGARVTVVGDVYGWYKIEPPAGAFSLIDKTYVDRDPSGVGVVNGNAVWVRTGSDMSDAKYARQLKLDRGAEVKVIGETEGHYKIQPPPGAYVYIHASFVTRVPADRLAEAPPASPTTPVPAPAGSSTSSPPQPADSAAADLPIVTDASSPGESPATPPATDAATATPTPAPAESATLATQTPPCAVGADAVITDAKARIDAIEAEVSAEVAKPLAQQSFDGAIERFRAVARGTNDDVWRQYAERRAEQLARRQSTLRMWAGVQQGSQTLDTDLRAAEASRVDATIAMPAPPQSFDVTGEFRKSLVFDSPVLPRRYKLVDPRMSPARTIAYIEIPRNSPINPNLYIGRYVGVVASRRFYQEGTVEAIEVFVPRQIVILNEPGAEEMPVDEIPAEVLPVTHVDSPEQANAPVRADGTEGE